VRAHDAGRRTALTCLGGDALWRDLGISPIAGGAVTLHEDAPLSTLRQAIVTD